MDWKKPFSKKNPDLEILKKTDKIENQTACVNKKNTNEKAIFCSYTDFSLYFKIRLKKFTHQANRCFNPVRVSA